ncbi:MAG: hypothetical protein Q9186_007399, partial [Xanthomendoza sp. 1 TL-2023]
MEYAPGLGVFALLPRELRDQIWGYVSTQRRLKAFQTSHQIYAEASQLFYKNQSLQFQISPRYRYKSWLVIKSNFGGEWPLQSLDHAIEKGFDKLPFHKLKQIQIIIEAPDRNDPGQLICLEKKCRELAELLEYAKEGLPDLEIILLDSTSAKWTTNGSPQISVSVDPQRHYPPLTRSFDFHPEGPSDDEDESWDHQIHRQELKRMDPKPTWSLDECYEEDRNTDDDAYIVLYAFFRLRNIRSAKISEPVQRDGHFSDSIATTMEQKQPFGTWLDPDDPWNDAEIQKERDCIYAQLDLDLDLLPGPTANMMRLDRFSSWYTDIASGESKYEKEHERIFKSWTDFPFCGRRVWSLFRRFACMPTVKNWISDRDAAHKAWPEGIPPLDSSSECSTSTLNFRPFRSYWRNSREDEFERKLTSWFMEEDGTRARR